MKYENMIIVTNNFNKEKILKKIDKTDNFYNIKFMNMKDIAKNYYFSYDERALYYLIDKYNFNVDIAKMYLNNLYYIELKSYNDKKLDFLVKLKKDLIDNNYLIVNPYFKNEIKNKKIVFYKFNYFTKLQNKLIKELKELTDVEIVNKEEVINKHIVFSFDNIYDEVEYVAKSIVEIVDKGISLDKIKICNLNKDYNDVIKDIFPMYKLDFNLNDNLLYSTEVCQEFLKLNGTIEERVNVLKNKYKNNDVLNKLIDVVNKYIIFDDIDIVLKMLISEFKSTFIKNGLKNNTIDVVNLNEYPFNDENYVFLLNFNQNAIPVTYKDEDFIPDRLKENIFLDTSSKLNKLERECTIKNILGIKNLTITYKLTTSFDKFYPSNLIDDLGFKVEKEDIDVKKSYSDLAMKTRTSLLIDDYLKTGVTTNDLKFLYSNYNDSLTYFSYDNNYHKVNKDNFLKFINNKFNLSYSSMDNYYHCPFRYYLTNVLRLDIYEENFITYLGSLFHYCLEKGLVGDQNVEELVHEFIQNEGKELSLKEKFLIKNIIPNINDALNFIKDELEHSNLKNMLFEKEIEIDKSRDNVDVVFKGFVDKILYNDDKSVAAIVDYKTGKTDINLNNVNNGLGMQLPIYVYLLKHTEELKNAFIAGFYLEQVLHNKESIDYKHSLKQIKNNELKLYGYSNSNPDILEEFDKTFNNSGYIKSMKLNQDGSFNSYAKVLSNEKIDNLVKYTDKVIDNAIDKIIACEFDIAPRKTSKENLGCKYCKFKDICFKENRDEVLIERDDDLSFLEGDNNGKIN